MPLLLIQRGRQEARLLILPEGRHLIGRSEDASVLLPNISISRRHALLEARNGRAEIEDLDSQNGLQVNERRARWSRIHHDDQIRLGQYTMRFLDEAKLSPDERRQIDRLELFGVPEAIPEGATLFISEALLLRAQRSEQLRQHAVLRDVADLAVTWPLGEKTMTIGPQGLVQTLRGRSPVLAEIAWSGTGHLLRRTSLWGPLAPVRVNGVSIQRHQLFADDCISVGGRELQYTLSVS
jgi:hypothetical protein